MARAYVVQIVAWHFGVLRRTELLRSATEDWIDSVGNLREEEEGMLWQGDFWHFHHLFRVKLDNIIDIPTLDLREAAEIQRADLWSRIRA